MQTTSNLVYLISYFLFFTLSWIGKTHNSNRLINDNGELTSRPLKLIGFHIIGIIILGLVPMILLNHSVIILFTGNKAPDLPEIFIYLSIFIPLITIAFKQSKSVYGKNNGLAKSLNHLSITFFASYFIIRVLFLFTYELWFRGFVLFDFISWIGVPFAIFVNILLYVSVHIFNSKKEMLACIPFGVLVCALCILFDAVWPAIILHISFSLAYELSLPIAYRQI